MIQYIVRQVVIMEKKVSFAVKGMHCHSCEVLIKDCLEETPGVISASVSQKKGIAEIVFDSGKIVESGLKDVIRACGFEVA
jgi:copper chaperone CopZ